MKTLKNLLQFIFLFLLFNGCINLKSNYNLKLTLKIEADSNELTQQEIESIQTILSKRLENYGISKRKQSIEIKGNNINIEINNIKDPQNIKNLLTTPGKLGFWETYDMANIEIFASLIDANKIIRDSLEKEKNQMVEAANNDLKAENENQMSLLDELEARGDEIKNLLNQQDLKIEYPLFSILQPNINREGLPQPGSVVGYATDTNISKVNEFLAMPQVIALFPGDMKLLWSISPVRHTVDPVSKIYELHAIKVTNVDGSAVLDESFIKEAISAYDQYSGNSYISITMDDEGAMIWRNMTRNNIDKYIAITVDDKVCTSAKVLDEISGGKTSVSGGFSEEEAKKLINILNSASLPDKLTVVNEKITSN